MQVEREKQWTLVPTEPSPAPHNVLLLLPIHHAPDFLPLVLNTTFFLLWEPVH